MGDVGQRPDSVVYGRDKDVLPVLFSVFCPAPTLVLDCTANGRVCWRGWDSPLPDRIVFADIDPETCPDVVADFHKMPFADEAFDVVVFDPPHLPAAAASARSHRHMQRYGLARGLPVIPLFLEEAVRVLKPDGLVFAKIKDYVHNHRRVWATVDFVNAVTATEGLTACDQVVKVDPAGGVRSGRWRSIHHLKCRHTSWIVARKGRCERKKR